jgi:hypothetical protein
MSGKVRAKFFVSTVTQKAHGAYEVHLSAVTKHGPHDPADNEFFWEATPSGEMTLHLSGIAGKGAFEYFQQRLSKDIYIDMIDGEGVYAKCSPKGFYDESKRYVVAHEPSCPEHDPEAWAAYEAHVKVDADI